MTAKTSLKRDISWNVLSFAVQGACLLGLQVVIARFYTAEDLGVFNQVFAAYIVFSQLAVGGIHLSVQKYLSEDNHNLSRSLSVALSALLTTVLLAAFWTILFYVSRNQVAAFLSSPNVSDAMAFAAPGLFFFALNKTLLGIINGLEYMRFYAFSQAIRAVALVGGVIALWIYKYPGIYLASILTACEVLLTLIILPRLGKFFLQFGGRKVLRHLQITTWVRTHLVFGTKGFLSGVLHEFNTRVDILILGYFLDDKSVGIYSFAAVFAEGLIQLTSVIRANYNPILSRLLAHQEVESMTRLIEQGKQTTYRWMALLSLAAVLLYPLATQLMTQNTDLTLSSTVFTILTVGVFAQSGYSPFMQILLQAGYPGYYSVQVAIIVFLNLALNILLVPSLGLFGAAIATATAWIASVFLFRWFSRRYLGISV